ncbi:MAG: TetR/AcrR family transcriptional regulator [Actinobacteria bacterium]|nr:TetR/AcrR family transcriptional regulator [Actinomycetota bacterium]
MTRAAAADPETEPVGSQRDRILEIALRLMSEHGVHAMSMRRLAQACGLNVATIYHYFPSKADLLSQVIGQRGYEERLLSERPPLDPGASAGARLAALVTWIWEQMSEQEDIWRLLLGESLRGDEEVLSSAATLSAAFEAMLDRWLDGLIADLPGDRTVTARVLRGTIYGFFIEYLPLKSNDRAKLFKKRAAEIASVLAPE